VFHSATGLKIDDMIDPPHKVKYFFAKCKFLYKKLNGIAKIFVTFVMERSVTTKQSISNVWIASGSALAKTIYIFSNVDKKATRRSLYQSIERC
jgi:hypothetical protein